MTLDPPANVILRQFDNPNEVTGAYAPGIGILAQMGM